MEILLQFEPCSPAGGLVRPEGEKKFSSGEKQTSFESVPGPRPESLHGRHSSQHVEAQLGVIDERFLQRAGGFSPVSVGWQHHAA